MYKTHELMEVSFLQFQRNYKMFYFKKVLNNYFNEHELENKSYEEFMKWCYSRTTKKNASLVCKAIGISKANIKSMTKMLNLLIFSKFHPILLENKRTSKLNELSQELCDIRNKIFDKLLYCTRLQTQFKTFCREKGKLLELLLKWERTLKEWKEIDKYLLVQDCIVHYVELINLQEQLTENEKKEKSEAEKKLNKITRDRIVIEKEKCKDRIEEIDGERGLRVMKGILNHISSWETSEKKLQEQIKTQMEKAFWNRIEEDIETEKFILCQYYIKELVEECATLFHHNVTLLDKLVDQIDFEFMKSRCETKTTDARYWYSVFISFVSFLQECDAKQNYRIYESKIDELYLWTEQLTFDRFKHMFFWIKDRIHDISERKLEFEKSDLYNELKRDKDV